MRIKDRWAVFSSIIFNQRPRDDVKPRAKSGLETKSFSACPPKVHVLET
jgi:hypothetical protein